MSIVRELESEQRREGAREGGREDEAVMVWGPQVRAAR